MKAYYGDIRSRIKDDVLWHDEYGVPRYEPFTPDACANIYAREAVLLGIECQGCGAEFMVAMTSDTMDAVRGERTLASRIEDHSIHYGDPPNTGCCGAGPTMNSIPRAVLQFWKSTIGPARWQRVGTLERRIDTGED